MARKYDITKNIESTTISFTEFSLESQSLVTSSIEIKDFDNEMSDDKIIAMLRAKYGHVNALQIVSKETVNAYYGMTKEDFVKYARKTDNKDGRNLIKRTLNAFSVSVMCYDLKANKTEYRNVFVDKIDVSELYTLKTLNSIRKSVENEDIRVITVKNYILVSEMYGMSPSDFIKHATVINSDEMNDNE